MRGGSALLASVGLAIVAAPASANPGDLVASFGSGGIFASRFQAQFPSDRQQAAAVDSQGRIVLAATRVDAQNREHLDIARLTPHGELDTTFNASGSTPGVVEVDWSNEAAYHAGDSVEARAVAVVGGDAIVALGVIAPDTAGDTTIGLVRLTATGAYDQVLTGDGRLATGLLGNVQPFPEALAVDGSGRMIVAGAQQCGACSEEAFIARLDATGALDTGGFDANDPFHPGVLTFGSHATNAFGLTTTADGKILAAGGFDAGGHAVIARVGGDGTLDATFGTGGLVSSALGAGAGATALAFDVAPGRDGTAYVGGQVTQNGRSMRVLRLTSTGSPDAGFGTAGVASVPGGGRAWSVVVDGSGCPVVAGSVLNAGHGGDDLVVARLTGAGVLDQGFGAGGITAVPPFSPPGNGDYAQGETIAFAGVDPVVAGFRRAGGNLASTRALVLRFEGGGTVCGASPGGGGGGSGGGGGGSGGSGGQSGPTPPVPRFTIGERAALPNSLSFNASATSTTPGASVTDYIWDTDGNGTYDWHCGRSPVFAEGFHTAAGQHTIGLRVVDSLGLWADTRIRVDVPASAVNSVRPDQNVVDCENPAAGNQADRGDCVKSFGFGIIDVNSRGERNDCFQLTPRSTIAHISQSPVGRKAVFYYRARLRGPLAVNGLYVPLPESATSEFDSGDETIDVGLVEIGLGPFTTKPLDLRKRQVTPKDGVYHVDHVLLAGANAALGKLPIKGAITLDLVRRASLTTVSVGLPKPFSLDPSSAKGTQGAVTLRADNVNGVSFDGVKVKFDAYLGALTLRNAQLTYSKSKDLWSGGADIFPAGQQGGAQPDRDQRRAAAARPRLRTQGGAFDHAGIGLDFLGAARPVLFPGIFLSNIHVAFGVGPFRLTGGLGIAVGDAVDIDGDVFVAFASPSQPYGFGDKDAAGDLAPLAGRTFDSFTIALGGTASLDLPVLGKVALAHAVVRRGPLLRAGAESGAAAPPAGAPPRRHAHDPLAPGRRSGQLLRRRLDRGRPPHADRRHPPRDDGQGRRRDHAWDRPGRGRASGHPRARRSGREVRRVEQTRFTVSAAPTSRLRGGEGKCERLLVGPGPQCVGGADRLFEPDGDGIAGDGPAVGQ